VCTLALGSLAFQSCEDSAELKHWHRLPREAVDAPSLEVVKARLDGALSNLV